VDRARTPEDGRKIVRFDLGPNELEFSRDSGNQAFELAKVVPFKDGADLSLPGRTAFAENQLAHFFK
jgi:hypothetical protein